MISFFSLIDKNTRTVFILLFFCFMLLSGFAEYSVASGDKKNQDTVVNQNTRVFSITVQPSRLVYNLDSAAATLQVVNPQSYPVLVQTKIFGEDLETPAPFVVTPPLFRLEAAQQNRLRIVRTGGDFPSDRESLQWICVMGIPPSNIESAKSSDDNEALLDVRVRVNNCVRMFLRPSSLRGSSVDVAGELQWSRNNGLVQVNNPTSFWMSLTEVQLGGVPLEGLEAVPPKGSRSFKVPTGASGSDIEWKVIADYGAPAPLSGFHAKLDN